MNTPSRLVVTACFAGCVLLAANSALGWGPYTHWWVGNQIGLGSRVNLPDYWGQSHALHYSGYDEIVPLFPWTHGCMRTGLVAGLYPDTPTVYGQAQAIAEWDMYDLVEKMSCSHQQSLNASDMIDTARGFLVHNDFDANGHFSLFPGGTIGNWLAHKVLEEYVEYRMIDQPPGKLAALGAISQQIGSQGHAGIILLAQKCFRKNRHTIDTVAAHSGVKEPGPVETLSQTAGQISTQAANLSPLTLTDADYGVLILEMMVVFPADSINPLTGLPDPATLMINLNAWWLGVVPSLQPWANYANGLAGSMPQVGPNGCLP